MKPRLRTLRHTLRTAALFAASIVALSCGEPRTSTAPGAADTALLNGRRAHAVSDNATITSITVETRYWNSTSPLAGTDPNGRPTGSEANAIFNALTTPVAGYTNSPVPVSTLEYITNVSVMPVGSTPANQNIATRYVVNILVTGTQPLSVSMRFGPDYGGGGAMIVDGTQVASEWGNRDFWWNYSWADPKMYFQATVTLVPGSHTVTVVGFEDGDDGPMSAQFDFGDGWFSDGKLVVPPPPPPIYDAVTTVQVMTVETRYWGGTSFDHSAAGATAAFEALPTDVPGYTNTPIRVSALANNAAYAPGGKGQNIATRFRILLNTVGTNNARVSFRIGPDYSEGGVLIVDGVEAMSKWKDIWFGGVWNNPYQEFLEQDGLILAPGTHEVVVVGFEKGDDAAAGAQFDFGLGAGWQDIETLVPAVPSYLLSASSTGSGNGNVVSMPAGIDCWLTCSYSFPADTRVTLSATPAAGSNFGSWSGACTGTGPCIVTVGSAATVSALFRRNQHPLTITNSGTGAGSVASNPVGISCGSTCTSSFDEGSTVTLSASPAGGSIFAGWTGACSGTGACSVVMGTSSVTVGATFTALVKLTVAVSGTSGGTVSSDAGITNCGGTCTSDLAPGTPVRLWATPASGWAFSGWTGGTCTGTADCTVVIGTGPLTVGAQFTRILETLKVTPAGTGGGTVQSTTAGIGINCGTSCIASVPQGTVVSLTATPASGSTFAGWSGPCTVINGVCTVTLASASEVVAQFVAIPVYTLTVSRAGTGGGTVSGTAGSTSVISCGTSCTASLQQGTVVALTATPASGSTFAGWSGACSGTGTCTVTVAAASEAVAEFAAIPVYTLTVSRAGTGSGSVSGTVGSTSVISCGTSCTASLQQGTVVALTATPTAGSTFAGWSGACSGAGTCSVTVAAASTVVAQFTAIPTFSLTVSLAGTGSGSVTSSPTGIACGSASCSASFVQGTKVTLTAAPTNGSTFAGWSGACAGTGTCTVNMAAAAMVSAQFTKTVDTPPPSLSCAASPNVLWPPNHKMIDIRVTVLLNNAAAAAGSFKLLSVTSDEPDDAPEVLANGRHRNWGENRSWRDENNKSRRKLHLGSGRHSDDDDCGYIDDDDDDDGDGSTVNDIQGWLVGTADVFGQLRAERAGGGDGRTYTLRYTGTDKAGKSATASCTVTVPLNRGK